jgi:hypothetical protein
MEGGSSVDFHALHYHVSDLDALLTIAIRVPPTSLPPTFLSSRSLARIERAVAFL